MIEAKSFIEQAKAAGFSLYTGVPCSYLKPFINYVIDAPDLEYIGATNEGDAVAIASGAEIAGRRSVVMFQNSGFGNTVSPLTSLNMIFKVPVLVITTWRGEPGGAHDEPQHELMGQITGELFDLMRIKWEFFPAEESQVAAVIERAVKHMDSTGTPYGLVMKKDTVAPHKLTSKPKPKPFGSISPADAAIRHAVTQGRPTRREVLSEVQKLTPAPHAVVATTGFTGRALYALDDRDSQLYMVGSMGCVSSFALGIAVAKPNRKVVALDGDGAITMRMGALATVGYERPKNMIHVLLDNEVHDSTGGQETVSHSLDLALVAHACGYPQVKFAASLAEFSAIYAEAMKSDTLTFIHIKTAPGESPDLPRPKVTPVQVAERFKKYLAS
ncbi:MAG: phosphonopyruvate decarboxylase [Turneriella sp.]|nr:phosphonopyruvate decarboxylase [Turneriella sp.]